MLEELRAGGRKRSEMLGFINAAAAFLLWGVLPLYWKLLQSVSSLEILANRIIWSFVFSTGLLFLRGQGARLKGILAERKKVLAAAVAALLVSFNWGVYIWAVNAGHVVDVSLGYYINPLLSVCLGMLILQERLGRWQTVSVFLALAGVAIITVEYGAVPWVALSLAISFGLYGLIKKMANIDSVVGLALETLFLAPVALAYLGFVHARGGLSFGGASFMQCLLLIGAGPATALPLIWFGRATQRIPLSTVGFVQYVTPTIMLLIGVLIYKEPFSTIHLAGFALIWCALVIFSWSQVKGFNTPEDMGGGHGKRTEERRSIHSR